VNKRESYGTTDDTSGHGQLNGGIQRKRVDRTFRKKSVGSLRTTENLEEHGNRWRGKLSAVHLEVSILILNE